MKQYVGSRLTNRCVVSVINGGAARDLNCGLEVQQYSEVLDWSQHQGAKQLALAICLDALKGDADRARKVFVAFKLLVVSHIVRDTWTLTEEQVLESILAIENVNSARAARPEGVSPF